MESLLNLSYCVVERRSFFALFTMEKLCPLQLVLAIQKHNRKNDIDCVYVWIYIQYLIKNQETNYINKSFMNNLNLVVQT